MTTFITYNDVCDKATKSKQQRLLSTFHKQKKFAAAFQLIFKFTNPTMSKLILNNWEKAIESEIKNCKNLNIIDDEEAYQIKRISLKELTTIANIGKYSINILKMKPHVAMAFTLGIYYGTFIFEQTGMYLTIDEIYDIIPKYKQKKGGYKIFQRRFFVDGTDKAILKILFNK